MRAPRDPGALGWRAVRDDLAGREVDALAAHELDLLADAWFWLDDPDRSVEIRRLAYRRHDDAGDDHAAAAAAWRLFFDHHLVGETAQASGWLARCRQHAVAASEGSGTDAIAGWLAIADAHLDLTEGRAEASLDAARDGTSAGRSAGDADLVAMGLQSEGRALIAIGDHAAGTARLDEAMLSVVNDELHPLYTGWVYCNVVSSLYELAAIERAAEWSDAAVRWCETLQDGSMYPGLCRVYQVDIACLRGHWRAADAAIERACAELDRFDRRYAATAWGLAGDLHRLRGDHDRAAAAYAAAIDRGALPQPGLGLLRLAHGDAAGALAELTSALAPGPRMPLPRALLLAAVVDAAIAVGDAARVVDAAGELRRLAETCGGTVIEAFADAATGEVALGRGDGVVAVASLRRAVERLDRLEVPYESARRRVRLAAALRSAGDHRTAERELHAAAGVFERLRAEPDLRRARAGLDDGADGADAGPHADACPLSPRELEVLALVAAGRTDREIADELVLSTHTIARHVSNIRTKLTVPSRTAATAVAVDRGWLAHPGSTGADD